MYRLAMLTALAMGVWLLDVEPASARGRGGCGCCFPCCAPVYYAPCPPMPPHGRPLPPKKKEKEKEAAELPGRATLVVELPADARLLIDDRPTSSTSPTRVFQSPPVLEPGKEYTYTLKAEVVREGEVLSVTREVTVRANETTQIRLQLPVAATASTDR
jgi:uncharacterized protein (TIGR03000 family)